MVPSISQVVGHYGVGDVNGGSLRGNLQLPGNTSAAVAGNCVGGFGHADLLVGGCGPVSGIGRIEPPHRVAVGVRDLLQHPQVGRGGQKPLIEHGRGKDHLMHELVLLFGEVVRLESRRRDLDGVGEDLSALLDLLELVGDGLFFVFDLGDGVDRLRRIVDDTGAELRLRRRLQCWGKSDGQCGNDEFLHCLSFR
jgi:hypothetical protein